MAAALKRFSGPSQIPNADTTLFAVPVGERWTVKQIVLANTDAANHPITVSVGSVAAPHQIVPNSNIAANVVSTINLTLPLEAGEELHAISPSGLITVTVSGVTEDVA